MDELKNIPINKIYPDENQPRKLFDPSDIAALAQSIAQVGLLNPISVRKKDDGDILIAGERRYRACALLNMSKVPCIVKDTDEKTTALCALIENIQRKDLNPFEEALALRQLIESYGLTQSRLAEYIGKSQSAVANKLRLLSLSSEVRELILRENLTERHARELTRLPHEKQLAAARHIAKCAYTVADTEKYVTRLIAPQKSKQRIYVFKDIRLFTNTIDRSLTYLKKAGVNAHAEKHEDESTIRYLITIPKRIV